METNACVIAQHDNIADNIDPQICVHWREFSTGALRRTVVYVTKGTVPTVQPWLKFYETIKPLLVAWSLFLAVSTGFILCAPKSMIVKLGMARVIADYRWVVGLGFLIAATWLAGFIMEGSLGWHGSRPFTEQKSKWKKTFLK